MCTRTAGPLILAGALGRMRGSPLPISNNMSRYLQVGEGVGVKRMHVGLDIITFMQIACQVYCYTNQIHVQDGLLCP